MNGVAGLACAGSRLFICGVKVYKSHGVFGRRVEIFCTYERLTSLAAVYVLPQLQDKGIEIVFLAKAEFELDAVAGHQYTFGSDAEALSHFFVGEAHEYI